MLNKLLYRCGLKKKKPEPKEEDLNTFTITINNNEPFLKISITETDPQSAKAFATMLYDLHKGLFVEAISKTLLGISQNDQYIRLFVQNVLVEWKRLCDYDKEAKKDPVIKPTHFFKQMKGS